MSGQVGRLSSLIDSAVAVVGEVELEQVLRRLVSEARSATGASYAALGVLGPHGVLTDFVHEGLQPGTAEQIGSLPKGRGVLGTVVRSKETIVLDHIADHPDSFGFPDHHPVMDSFLGVPVRSGEVIFGNLYLTEKTGGFTDDDVQLVEALATIAGAAVSTTRLHKRLEHAAIVEDRDRIARDLHDSIIQDLFAIGLGLQGLSGRMDDTATSTMLDDAVDRLHSAVEALRAYIYELKDENAGSASLEEHIADLAERLASAYPVELVIEAERSTLGADPRIIEEVVKLTGEAMSNALRHASASLITVHTSGDVGGVVIVVSDDGVGFDPNSVKTGLGLLNIQERARRLGGSVSIDSVPGRGTRVSIEVPIS